MNIQNKVQIASHDNIFATGVFLQAVEIEISGMKEWRWVAVGFEDDIYFNGNTIDVYNYADSFEGLINKS